MDSRSLIILILLLGAVIPFYFINKWGMQYLQPRRSPGRLAIWMLLMLGLVFVFGFLLVWIITQLFPRS
ncbi:MAG: hypothetical protein NVV59_14060 [Chitinophagaceae bacterium]|nr:hypothetical protein [Chitinophagaceae bacterium]